MQRIAHCFLALCALALLTGCEDKNKAMEMEPLQTSSVAYEEPSYNYYAPDSSAAGANSALYDQRAPDSAAPAALLAAETHVVAKGDTLYALARMYYSDQSKWKDIYQANRQVLDDPNTLRVGQELVIP